MKKQTLSEIGNAGLITRAYNLGLKLVPNVSHILTLEELEYWEKNVSGLKYVVERGFKRSADDLSFPLLKSFKLPIPIDYVHANRLGIFKEKNKEEFSRYNPCLTDEEFARVRHHLIPGKTYTIKIFGITRRMSAEDCLEIYKMNNAYYTGAQGASVVWEYRKDELIKGKEHYFLEERDSDAVNVNSQRVANIYARSTGEFDFDGAFFTHNINTDCVIVVFCDCNEA